MHYEAMDRTEAVLRRTQRREHLWVVLAAWTLSEKKLKEGGSVLMDQENILTISDPGCYKCEQAYSPEVAAQPCYEV